MANIATLPVDKASIPVHFASPIVVEYHWRRHADPPIGFRRFH
jgi:hypothetical protein